MVSFPISGKVKQLICAKKLSLTQKQQERLDLERRNQDYSFKITIISSGPQIVYGIFNTHYYLSEQTDCASGTTPMPDCQRVIYIDNKQNHCQTLVSGGDVLWKEIIKIYKENEQNPHSWQTIGPPKNVETE